MGATVDDPTDKDDDRAPETPLDEPRPPQVQDPPPQPDPRGPYVVGGRNAPADSLAGTGKNGGGAVSTAERKERRGFASMSAEKQREIASKGGRAAHEKGTAHEWTADEARNAGRKGGQVSRGGRGRLVIPDAPPAIGTPDAPLAEPASTASRID